MGKRAMGTGTLSLSDTGVATGTAGLLKVTGAAVGVHGVGFLDDEAVRDQLADGIACDCTGSADALMGAVWPEPSRRVTNGSWRRRSHSSRYWGVRWGTACSPKYANGVLFVEGAHPEAGSSVQTYARRSSLSNVGGDSSLRLCDVGDYS